MAVSLSYRTAKVLKDSGWLVATVEYYNAYKRRNVDLFGIIDILALRGPETLAIQATSKSNTSARVHKIESSSALSFVLAAGWRLEVWGWYKEGRFWRYKVIKF